MILGYVGKALESARYEKLADGRYYGEIRSCRGVWATSRSLEACRRTLQEVLEEWILLKVRDGEKLPVIGGARLRVGRKAAGG